MDDFVYEINNLIVRLDEMRDRLKTANPDAGGVFSNPEEQIALWRNMEEAVRLFIRRRGKEVAAGEIIYILSAFLKWHLEKVLKEYYNDFK
ncbi:MAG: hypothetical protein PHQ23_14760 [Candidatus Wallbacteria bacterium]|nr:hypothetical protein [Candidatus Wallbacteria bacterium]